MIEYTIQPKGEGSYAVHKWDDGDMPTASYLVTAYSGKLTCNCPAGKWHGYCKHTTFVRDYRSRERKSEPIEMLMKVFYKGSDM